MDTEKWGYTYRNFFLLYKVPPVSTIYRSLKTTFLQINKKRTRGIKRMQDNTDHRFPTDNSVGILNGECPIQAIFVQNVVESQPYQQIGQSTENTVCIEMDLLQVGSEPVGIRCPHCQEDMMTKATYRNSTLTHIIAIVLGILFWWLCCCIIPYVTKKWKNVEHYCPNCGKFLGSYERKSIF